ncbi:Lrp/AsnC family transcriptional regulator [Steroidobacter sp.]|uniref:Lrp/AsnC family transcriptional regulator n=1 Tax=Steroidobacter sp. TaxID=1978227 RepID=UPI001A42A0B8|nr:Lrp/AsnC family transcriptional regulator [Steroidobacter sp.]MBL8267784.1 Lrp/AsnC family transcriptional regulator [Steroidobacter sp.]
MPSVPIDAYDRRILEALQADGRLTNLELAERVGLSPSPCLRRVRALEAEGLIKGYGARLDRKKIGLGMTVFVAVNIELHKEVEAAKFRDALLAFPEVVSCYITSGDFDFLLQVVTPDLDAYREFSLERLIKVPGVKGIHSSFVIDTVKDGAPFPLTHLSVTRPAAR